MNIHIHRLLDEAFAGVEQTPEAQDLKEEVRANLVARVDELEGSGRSPEDAARTAIAELGDVRALLDAKGIAYYETPPSFWGISAGGIWVTEDSDFAEANHAFDDYEQQRSVRVRAEYDAAKRAGTAETFIGMLRSDPLRVALALLGILLALGLVVLPVILLRG